MTREEAKSELMQLYGMLSEEKKQALDVLMAQAEKTCDIEKSNFDVRQYKLDTDTAYECGYNAGLQAQADGEYISREAVIDIIEDVCPIYGNDYRYILREKVNELPIKAIPSAEPKWIPCSERLPEKDKSVLLTICANSALYGFNENFVKVMCGSYSPCEDERDWIVNEIRYYIDNVIAWMPFEPYKGE